eukprot:GILK01002342.1.p1 GENE.GILK01002342.1~~GILK01002342.1.p1  ORF type:complete len:260 (+),score=51.66 GILK01002342.1:97-780(+)
MPTKEASEFSLSLGKHRGERSRRTDREANVNTDNMTTEELQAHLDHMQDKSLASLKNTVQTAYQTEELAVASNVELARQTEQLKGIHSNLEDIDEQQKRSKFLLRGMASWGGAIRNFFSGGPKSKKKAEFREISLDGQGNPNEVKRHMGQPVETRPAVKSGKKNFDDQLDEGLDELNNVVGRLHLHALNMGNEVDKQMVIIDSIDTKTDQVDGEMKNNTRTIKRILR